MTVPTPTNADRAAAAALLGRPVLRHWTVRGTNRLYLVEEREDTRNGGLYLFCPCPGWKYKASTGGCKHCWDVREREAG